MLLPTIVKMLNECDIFISPSPVDGEGVGYSLIPVNNNKIVEQLQLEIKISNKSLLECYKIKAVIDSVLLTLGDKTHNGFLCEANGGGQYRDVDTRLFILQINYVITERMM